MCYFKYNKLEGAFISRLKISERERERVISERKHSVYLLSHHQRK